MTLFLALLVVAMAGSFLVPRARQWHRSRHRPRRDFCEQCGAEPRRIYVLQESFDNDRELGLPEGQTFVAATYCRSHSPCGARKRPNRRR